MSILSHLFQRASTPGVSPTWEPLAPVSSGIYYEERRHIPDIPYMLPKDVLEEQRLNFQHHLLQRVLCTKIVAA